jgi:hypothetical protein
MVHWGKTNPSKLNTFYFDICFFYCYSLLVTERRPSSSSSSSSVVLVETVYAVPQRTTPRDPIVAHRRISMVSKRIEPA